MRVPSFLPRWLCRVYRIFLYAYPPDFRRSYGREMEQVFGERCRHFAKTSNLAGLLVFVARSGVDWLVTTFREGFAPAQVAPQISSVAGPAPDVPAFYTCGPSMPSQRALFSGAVLSLAAFGIVATAIGQGGGRMPWRLIGSRWAARSPVLPTPTTAAPAGRLDTEVRVGADPEESAVSLYFRMLPVSR